MVLAGVEAEELHVQHVREPGQGMPVGGVGGGEGPRDGLPAQPLLDVRVFGDIDLVVVD